MGNQLRKHKFLFALVGGFFILVIVVVADIFIQNEMKRNFSTPELIGIAYTRGEITNEQRLLYLAYALMEPQSLPARYQSNVEWFGESIAEELQEALTPPEVICSMSSHVRSEFQRLSKLDMTCK